MSKINDSILYARRRLEEIDHLEIVDDIHWDDIEKRWYIKLCIYGIDTQNEGIKETTYWYITFPDTYPKGEVKVYPACVGGITYTFNHQNNNGLSSANKLWRSGNICLSNNYDGLMHEEIEPTNYEDKLFWNAQRAVEWVIAVANNSLIKKGDYYEIPHFVEKKALLLAYNEDIISYMEWEDVDGKLGYVEIIKTDSDQLFARNFYSISGKICKTSRWGAYIEEHGLKSQLGAWILLEREPVINFWQAPNTYDELKVSMRFQGRHLINELKQIIPLFRDRRRHIIMIGFPVPDKIGFERKIIHWEAFLLPELSCGNRVFRGFRNNECGWQTRDFLEVIPRQRELEWLICNNWNSDEILNRGHFERKMTRYKFIIIGAGTLGASVGELLIRGGIYNIAIMDDDYYEMGNAARHILEIDSVGKPKANELCKHYNCITPNVNAMPIIDALSEANINILDNYDVIIDCTASSEVLTLLSLFKAKKEKFFISISFGYNADELFFVYQRDKTFDKAAYFKALGNRIRSSEENYLHSQLPWDGIGCWHPVFPAMASDVQMIASVSVGIIKSLIESDEKNSKYYVYEKKYDQNGVVLGFARI